MNVRVVPNRDQGEGQPSAEASPVSPQSKAKAVGKPTILQGREGVTREEEAQEVLSNDRNVLVRETLRSHAEMNMNIEMVLDGFDYNNAPAELSKQRHLINAHHHK